MSKKKKSESKAMDEILASIEKILDKQGLTDRLTEAIENSPFLTLDSVNPFTELQDFCFSDEFSPDNGKDAENVELPYFVDFWSMEYDKTVDVYSQLKEKAKSLTKKKLVSAINQYLDTIPYFYYEREETNIMVSYFVMLAEIIMQHDLEECHGHLMQLLRMDHDIIMEMLSDEFDLSTTLYAEVCHDELDDLFDIATDDAAFPLGRGVAIAALAKCRALYPELTIKVNAMLEQILTHYKKSARGDRKVSVAMIRTTSLICAMLHYDNMMPMIEDYYRSLRISSKGIGAISHVKEIMEDVENYYYSMTPVEEGFIEQFLSFTDMSDLSRLMNFAGSEDDEDLEDEEEDDDDFFFGDDDEEEIDNYELILPDKDRKTKPKKILPVDIATAHPKGIGTSTDSDYAKLANDLLDNIHKANLVSNDMERLVALKCTLYLEDMVADAGIWRSFVYKHNGMYGKRLPFFEIDDAEYFEDEPNLADIQLIVWLAAMDETEYEEVLYSKPGFLSELADLVYTFLTNAFEKMPINVALKDYFAKASFMSDFLKARDAMKWAFFSSYVSHNSHNSKMFAQMMAENESVYGKHTAYQSESLIIFDSCVGPLAIEAKEWVAMILKANGNSDKAKVMESVRNVMETFHVVKREKGIYTLLSPDGTKITMKRKNFGEIKPEQEEYDYVFCCLAYFAGEWYLSGVAFWGDFDDKFLDRKEYYEELRAGTIDGYDKIIEDHMGSPVFYFKNKTTLNKFLTDKVNSRVGKGGEVELETDDDEEWILYLAPNTENIAIQPWEAYFIHDPRNPCFDMSAAHQDNNIDNLLSMPYGVYRFVVKHHYYEHVYVKQSDEWPETPQFDDNADFIYRLIHPDYVMDYNAMIK